MKSIEFMYIQSKNQHIFLLPSLTSVGKQISTKCLHIAESFLGNKQLLSQLRNPQYFIDVEGSLQSSQEPSVS
jgi:hypothetical protein